MSGINRLPSGMLGTVPSLRGDASSSSRVSGTALSPARMPSQFPRFQESNRRGQELRSRVRCGPQDGGKSPMDESTGSAKSRNGAGENLFFPEALNGVRPSRLAEMLGSHPNAEGLKVKHEGADPVEDYHLEIVAQHPAIRHLDLFQCPNITDDGIAHLRALRRLEHLNLGFSALTDEGMDSIGDLTSLQHLNLTFCIDITKAGFEKLNQLPNLKELILNSSEITDDGFASLTSLQPRLRHLNMSFCAEISSDSYRLLPHFSSLTSLELENQDMDDTDLQHVAKMPALEHLSLRSDFITDAGVSQLSDSLKKLKSFSLYGSGLTAGVCQALKELPALEKLVLNGVPYTGDRLRTLLGN